MRLIDAEQIIDYLLDEGLYNGGKYGIKWGDNIKFSPSEIAEIVARTVPTIDAVPVVRCKDCKFWQDNNGGYPHEDCKWNHDETPDEDDYCSGGERRDSDG